MAETVPVSVVVPCWRCGDTITRAVESVAAQTWVPHEVILIDDASGDGTSAVLRALADRYPRGWIKVIEQSCNGGPGVARNAGWAAATSPYIAFLDADDAWHPQKLEIQLAWMMAHPEAAMTGTQTTDMERSGRLPPIRKPYKVREISLAAMLFTNMLPTRSVVIHQRVPHRFLPGKRYCEDYLLWVSAIAEGHRAFRIDLPLAFSFKPDFGAAGLSSHIWPFHLAIIDTYSRLYRAGHISWFTRSLLEIYALLKYGRRAIQSRKRRVPRHA